MNYYFILFLIFKIPEANKPIFDISQQSEEPYYQTYLKINKEDPSNILNNIKLFMDNSKNAHCPSIIKQTTGELLLSLEDTDEFCIYNIPHIYNFYNINPDDNIIIENVNDTNENKKEISITYNKIIN